MRRVRTAAPHLPGWVAAWMGLGGQTPQADEAGHRHATWLELFLDLIFVYALAAVVRRLGDDPTPSPTAVLAVLGLFVVVQWAWMGQVYYDTRFDPDDALHRLLVLVALVGAGAMTLGVDEVPESVLLPIGYLIVRGVLLLLYLRARPTSPAARTVTTVYLIGFGAGWLIWLASLAAPTELRPVLWVVAMVIELATPWLGVRWLNNWPVDNRHLPERIGQFTIIVLGSALANLLFAVPDHPPPPMIVTAAIAFLIPAAVWWVYTTFVTTRLLQTRLRGGQAYSYLHIPLGGALLLLGWALGQVVRLVDDNVAHLPLELRLLLGASIVVWTACGLALYWLWTRPSAARLAIAAYGVVSVSVITTTVRQPRLMLALVAAAVVGYAVLLSRRLARAGAANRTPEG
ncbi:low temperature requirement protein A [Micromonospora chokoriensis]|uniref:Low temperature requirement protein LtrA n=1 Tax=Micromonospora chokoriensis TaxID=356851 RepID=A0A1C4WL76_9ACTN|nr:low temperature requirement protein A [Micromonospora chokoriensis]SCE96987.1 Low temperature requirement protein LtrA [Micromonospora chokoriensis]